MGARKRSLSSHDVYRRRLLAWYDAHRRDLPWRQDGVDPYHVWVAETMLIQTQVSTVIPYYQRFLQRFPDLSALAAADLDEVLKLWEGLGYYARARNLHKAAQVVVQQHGGDLPTSPKALRTLPGIGPYLEAAIRSIAFGQPVLAADGNVRRVLSRLYDLERSTLATLRQLGAPLVAERPGDANQALMDLGATVCTPRAPACPVCPLASLCRARARGTVNQRPVRRPRRARPHQKIAVGVIWRDGEILIARRPDEGLLGGLWEFPGGKRKPGESLQTAMVREIAEELDIEVEPGERIATVDHAYSHFTIELHAFHCRYRSGTPKPVGCQEFAWVSPQRLDNYAFPAANRRVLDRLLEGRRPDR